MLCWIRQPRHGFEIVMPETGGSSFHTYTDVTAICGRMYVVRPTYVVMSLNKFKYMRIHLFGGRGAAEIGG
jgi:hypothetical protein